MFLRILSSILFLVIIHISNGQLVTDPRYVCFEEECTADLNNASPHCNKYCNELGYYIGHCGNWTEEAWPDYERQPLSRAKRDTDKEEENLKLYERVVGKILAGGEVDKETLKKEARNILSLRGRAISGHDTADEVALLRSEIAAAFFTKYGNACQCHRCSKDLCNKFCGTFSENNCMAMNRFGLQGVDVCGCGIDVNDEDNLLAIYDHLCGGLKAPVHPVPVQ